MVNCDLYKAVLRLRYDVADLDPKAVGGHLPLHKINSTPAGYDLGVTVPYSPLKSTMAPQQQQTSLSPHNVSPPHIETSSNHRRLDRSHSEPIRQQQQQPQQQQQQQQQQPNDGRSGSASSRYKTELCRPFAEMGACKYGEKCQFAHGPTELRAMPRHPKYKTELCRTFHTTGLCGYGARCHFIHNADERRSPGPSPVSPSSSPPSMPSRLLGPLPYLQTSEEPPSLSETPSHSLNGSPTSPPETFLNGSFSLLDTIVAQSELLSDTFSASYVSYPDVIHDDSPPESPIHTISCRDSFNTSTDRAHRLSSFHSEEPVGSCGFENGQYIRLPIFETFAEV